MGAGIVGASIAFHLARRGHPVTVLDSGLGASGATGASFAWVGRPIRSAAPSAPLRYLAVDDYRRLEREVPGLEIRWSGSLRWGGSGDEDEETWTSAAASLEPRLIDPPKAAHFLPHDGAFDPTAATDALLAAAQSNGAAVRLSTPVISLQREQDAVAGVVTASGPIDAATVVLAAGVGAADLCRTVGLDLPVDPSPMGLARFSAQPGLVRRIISNRDLEVRQEEDGTLLAPVLYPGENTPEALQAEAEVARRRIIETFADPGEIRIESVVVGQRPMPRDGEPIIGPWPGVRGLYLAVMHSGITLAAAVGRLVASEILDDQPEAELAGCRVHRFQSATATSVRAANSC